VAPGSPARGLSEDFQRVDNVDLLRYNGSQLAVEQAVLWLYVMLIDFCGDSQASKPWKAETAAPASQQPTGAFFGPPRRLPCAGIQKGGGAILVDKWC